MFLSTLKCFECSETILYTSLLWAGPVLAGRMFTCSCWIKPLMSPLGLVFLIRKRIAVSFLCPSLTYTIFFVFIGLHFSTFFSLTVMLLLSCSWLSLSQCHSLPSLRDLAVHAEGLFERFLLMDNVFSGACYGQGWM